MEFKIQRNFSSFIKHVQRRLRFLFLHFLKAKTTIQVAKGKSETTATNKLSHIAAQKQASESECY